MKEAPSLGEPGIHHTPKQGGPPFLASHQEPCALKAYIPVMFASTGSRREHKQTGTGIDALLLACDQGPTSLEFRILTF